MEGQESSIGPRMWRAAGLAFVRRDRAEVVKTECKSLVGGQ